MLLALLLAVAPVTYPCDGGIARAGCGTPWFCEDYWATGKPSPHGCPFETLDGALCGPDGTAGRTADGPACVRRWWSPARQRYVAKLLPGEALDERLIRAVLRRGLQK